MGSLLALLTVQESQLSGLNTSGFCVRGLQKELKEKHYKRRNLCSKQRFKKKPLLFSDYFKITTSRQT